MGFSNKWINKIVIMGSRFFKRVYFESESRFEKEVSFLEETTGRNTENSSEEEEKTGHEGRL